MARSIILGNGNLCVGLDEQGLVHDFYYPYVGLDNLNTARSSQHKIGIYVENEFSWTDDGSWQTKVEMDDDSLTSRVTMTQPRLGVSLVTVDFVDYQYNAFCRRLTVINNAPVPRQIRLFMHQVFQISRAGRADTALYVPDENYLLDYKGRCSLLIYATGEDGRGFDQYAVGNFGIEGKEGSFRDAEDGELSGNAVEHGGVDSVLRLSVRLDAGRQAELDYWVVAADSQYNAEKIHHRLLDDGLEQRLSATRQHWANWLATAAQRLHSVDRAYQGMVKKSLMVIKAHTDNRGGIIASCDSSIYNYGRDYYSYVWPRDGAYAMWPLIRAGYTDEPKRFFEFCRDILTPEGYLMHKYQPDKAIGSTWHPLVHGKHAELAIQEDETAIVIYMLGEYYHQSGDVDFTRGLYDTLVRPAANFMAEFRDAATGLPHASYDLWEEKFGTSTYTTAVVYQALLVAAEMAERFEYPDDAWRWQQAAANLPETAARTFFDTERHQYRKSFLLAPDDQTQEFDNTLDVSSLYGVIMFDLDARSERTAATLSAIEQQLLDKSPSGGLPRYEYDRYFAADPPYLGNPWIVTSLWLAQIYVRLGRSDYAHGIMRWALDRALPSGMLSEQINPSTGQPLSVTPLVWSHAEFVNTALDLSAAAHASTGGHSGTVPTPA